MSRIAPDTYFYVRGLREARDIICVMQKAAASVLQIKHDDDAGVQFDVCEELILEIDKRIIREEERVKKIRDDL